MGFFSQLFERKPPPPDPAKEVSKLLDRFATATAMGIDREDLARYPARQHKVMAFHYGAIEYMASEHNLDETQALGVFVMFIDKYFIMPISETGSISERILEFRTDTDQQRFLEAGADVFRRWHEENQRRAPLELGEMLAKP